MITAFYSFFYFYANILIENINKYLFEKIHINNMIFYDIYDYLLVLQIMNGEKDINVFRKIFNASSK